MSLRTDDFDYHLPKGLIATRPLPDRSSSRLLVLHRQSGLIEHRTFHDLPEYFTQKDLFVLNDTRVVPARYFSNDKRIELVRTELLSPTLWRSMVSPGKKMKPGRLVQVGTSIGTVKEIDADGNRLIEWDRPVDESAHGHLALPPYMERPDDSEDRERYQTVFSKAEGAIAAPTAGLHFTPKILALLHHTALTLHVGVGTFRPVKTLSIADHKMHAERFILSPSAAAEINLATEKKHRIIAVGTTVARVLEHLAATQSSPHQPSQGTTDIFIYPHYDFQTVDALLTNFHLPKSTLLMLVSAFSSRELILKSYQQAIERKYRFYSYGDCMLIL